MKNIRRAFTCFSVFSFIYTATVHAQPSPVATSKLDSSTAIAKTILQDKANFYYIDFKKYPAQDKTLPIGVFDSGTGGLTILNTLVDFDGFNNQSKSAGNDAIPDFAKEKFIYLADQANMPYGNYYSEKKTDLLVEHVLKDAQFMLADKYYPSATSKTYKTDKQKIKALVIACNTATAYGKEYIEAFIKDTGVALKVIGVIDAGAKGVLEVFQKDESGAIGVFATVGTVASKGYESTILKMKKDLGYSGNLQVYNQGGYGLAEAVDEEPDFISRNATAPRENYRGPSLQNASYKIDKTLLDIYNFDFDYHKMLCDSKNTDDCQNMQLNSADNYVRYHLVSMLEKIRQTPGAQPLKALVLGCTHYPYMEKEIRQVLSELYHYRKKDQYIYRPFMQENIKIIDPAVNVAYELHQYLKEQQLFNPQGNMQDSEFFISVPNPYNKKVQMDEQGRFTYAYKYGRSAGEIQEYVKVVPFSKSNIPAETIDRFKAAIPTTHALIRQFHQRSAKTKMLKAEEKITN